MEVTVLSGDGFSGFKKLKKVGKKIAKKTVKKALKNPVLKTGLNTYAPGVTTAISTYKSLKKVGKVKSDGTVVTTSDNTVDSNATIDSLKIENAELKSLLNKVF